MHRLILDTNVYIDWLNAGLGQEVVFQPGTVKLLSTVVMMELLAGAEAARDRKLLHDLFDRFITFGRLVVPSGSTFQEAGDVMRRLRSSRGFDAGRSASLAHDVLIAMSARSIGATVVTRNRRDFLAIQSVRWFKLTLVP